MWRASRCSAEDGSKVMRTEACDLRQFGECQLFPQPILDMLIDELQAPWREPGR